MNAKEARELTEKKVKTLEINWILKFIQTEVEAGNFFLYLYGNVSDNEEKQLKELGYKIDKSESIGNSLLYRLISW